jgi:FHS family Na+ dependent glucose MFS transporter 1
MSSSNNSAPHRIKQTICYYLALLALGLITGAVGPALPHLAEQTHSNTQDISFLFVSLALGYLLGSLASGRLIDHVKGSLVIITGLLGMAATVVLIAFTHVLWLLFILAFILGLLQSFVDIGCNLMIVWIYGKDVGPYINGLHLSFGIGTLISPLIIASSLMLGESITSAFVVLSVLSLPAAIGLIKLPNPLKLADPQAPREQYFIKGRVISLIIFIMLFYFVYIGFEAGFGAWLYTYAFETGMATEISAAYLTSIFWAAFTFGRLLGIPAARKLSPIAMILTGLVISLIGISLLSIFSSSQVILWSGTFVYGLGVSTLFPTLLTMASQYMTLSGKITGLFFASASLGGLFFPWLVGQLIGISGPKIMMPSFLVLDLSAILMTGGIFLTGQRLRTSSGNHQG